RSVTTNTGQISDRSLGLPRFSHAVLVKQLDKASNGLFDMVCNGQHLASAEVHFCTHDANQEPYAKLILSDILVANHENMMTADSHPVEIVEFDYAKIERTYIGRKGDNSVGSPSTSGYDLESAQKI
ncbi:MAG: type VI secretion system tube protein Hcp, partial [Gammaproteobacteria bacterium]|nr:type VI secretion system tube protein Hcp [Gammaproteobacteria bacterium]